MVRNTACPLLATVLVVGACLGGCGSGGTATPPVASPPVGSDPPLASPVVPWSTLLMVLVQENRTTGDTDIVVGDTAGGPLTRVTDTPLVREDMCAIGPYGAIFAFQREGEVIVSDGVTETAFAAGVVSNPVVSTVYVYWAQDHETFAGLYLETGHSIELAPPDGALHVDELSFHSDIAACSAVVAPSASRKIWLFQSFPERRWWPLQEIPNNEEQFHPSMLGDWVVYAFRDGSSPFSGLHIADALTGTILRTIRSAEADLTHPAWFHGEYHREVEMEPLSPEIVGYDLVYVKTKPGSSASVVSYDLETEVESIMYAGDKNFAYPDFDVAIVSGAPR